MRLLFWVQHLLGVGHVSRAQALVRALDAEGFAVAVAFGGAPLPDRTFQAQVHPLPAARAADNAYSAVVRADGAPADDAFWQDRRDRLLALHEAFDPAILLVEAWPFGRRPFSLELEALLARHRGFAATSVRDILQARREARIRETVRRAARLDAILVHADPTVVRLADSFPLARDLACEVVHTGFVAPDAPVEPAGDHDILVSGGGGAFALPLFEAAVAAARALPSRRFTVALGPNGPERMNGPANVAFVRSLSPFADHLAGARLSVSQAGYNTVMDLARAGTRSVLVPSDTHGQTEQAARARLWERAGRAVCLPESALTPDTLVAAIERAQAMAPARGKLRLDGAAAAARWLRENAG